MKKLSFITWILVVAGNCFGAPIVPLGYHETFATDAVWQYSQYSGTPAPPSITAVGNKLNINLGTDPTASGDVYADLAFNSSGGNFSGDYLARGSQLTVRFKLNAVNSANTTDPGSLSLFFESNGKRWIYASVQDSAVNSDVPYMFTIGNSALVPWFSVDTGKSILEEIGTFYNDFSNVDKFGFSLAGSGQGVQLYELSDLYLSVPEPETVWMILMVLASLGITFRSRLMELAGQVKARIRA